MTWRHLAGSPAFPLGKSLQQVPGGKLISDKEEKSDKGNVNAGDRDEDKDKLKTNQDSVVWPHWHFQGNDKKSEFCESRKNDRRNSGGTLRQKETKNHRTS